MGVLSDQDTDNPEHSVSLSSFLIGRYEVTYAVWKAVRDWSLSEPIYGYTYLNAGKEGHDGVIGASCTG